MWVCFTSLIATNTQPEEYRRYIMYLLIMLQMLRFVFRTRLVVDKYNIKKEWPS